MMNNPAMKEAMAKVGGADGLADLMKNPQMLAMAQKMMKDPKVPMHTDMYMYIYAHTHVDICVHVYICELTHTLSLSLTHTHIHVHMCE
jgi:phosphopantetheinyl transferase (holo-ACP synthase)